MPSRHARAELSGGVLHSEAGERATVHFLERGIQIGPQVSDKLVGEIAGAAQGRVSFFGRHAEAMTQIQDAQQIDPLSMSVRAASVELLYYARQNSQAIEAGKKAVQTDPNFPAAYLFLSRSYLATGKYNEAEEAELKYRELNGEPEAKRAALRRAFETGGIEAAWRWNLEDMKQRESGEYISPVDEARQQARLGQRQAALASLEKSYEIGDGSLVWIKVDPALDSLRQEPRFKNLLGKLHLDS